MEYTKCGVEAFRRAHDMPAAVCLAANVPEGMPGPEHFKIERVATPTVGDGILIELLSLSADPYMRGRLKGG